ncbi:COG4626 Phage terminase-like protein, large subunit [uncultured Caudovirales phage]|uniref:COG4626 Phage terminase-like protein, large subunit n=1 Tax=uncultured Caudovirales phage TaxID=2100421 RepID=A0A6J5SK81_9CAUD|nr:COG4626 Phage terminase-like protein, large subunit [uncultured Caudovirales phage]CAB4215318.1 COG4626 Phage terminase-like protein, large subunit [uncultured Caudovirales phage]CAB5230402.1 COG4626 Phage terminase-like protein, large subunit [uncultured Caudovirales phage]
MADFAEALVPIAKDSLGGLSGEPLVFREWQRNLLRHMLSRKADLSFTHRFFLVGVARKNGKTALASTLPIFFGLYGDKGGEILSAANEREQAKLVFSHARRAVELSPELGEQIKLYRDAMEFKGTGTVYKAISAEAYSKEGLNASLVLYDELAAAPNRELFDVLSLSMGARRSPLFVAITTAGQKVDTTGVDSIAYSLYQLAKRRIAGESDDASLGMAWWEAAEDAYTDEAKWADGNPGLLGAVPILSLDDLTSAKRRTPEAEFRTKRLNQFTSTATAFLPNGAWDACADTTLSLSKDDPIVVGHDGSFSNDSTAIVACRISDKALFVLGHWERAIDADLSWRVPVEEVEARMLEICKQYTVNEITCDPFRWQRSMEAWLQMGLPITEFPQTPARMVPATSAMYDAVVNGNLRHTGDPRLARHAMNATPYFSRNGLMVRKEARQSNRKIDLFVAAIMAHSRAGTLATTVAPKAAAAVQFIEL